MNEPQTFPDTPGAGTPEEVNAALFAQLVIQQSSMAMMLLGKTAHPETGKVVRDLEAAKLFIDQLEMIESKTKGNLSQEEAALLKQSLMSLRMAFVEAVDATPADKKTETDVRPARAESAAGPAAAPPGPAPEADEQRKRFTKKY
jgi:hypothetical protein